MKNLALTSLLALVAALAAALPAQATYPGASGQIAFGRTLDPNSETRAIFAANADGSGERQLTNPQTGTFDDQPDWSPDGTKVAFERCIHRCELWLMNADGSGATRLGPDCQNVPPPACEDRSGASWSPDGKSIAFNRAWGDVQNDQIQRSELWVMDDDGNHARPVTHLTAHHPYTRDVGNAMWSPNGKSLVLVVRNGALGKPAGHQAVFAIHADGSGPRRLTPWKLDAGDHPDWSPNGKLLLFRTVSADEVHGDLYTIRPNGSGLKRLTHYAPSTILLSSSFSPDGQSITFAKGGVGGQPDIFTMHLDGTGLSPVTQTALPDSAPDWGPAH